MLHLMLNYIFLMPNYYVFLMSNKINLIIFGEQGINIHWKDWFWSWSSNTLATCCEELTFGKDPDARKDWRQKEKEATENEMIR